MNIRIASAFLLLAFFSQALWAEERAYKIGTCDWSIQKPLSVDSFHFAKANGLHGIQYSFGVAGEGLDLRETKNREILRQTVKETGVSIASLGLGVLNKIPLATSDEADQLVEDCLATMVKLKEEAAQLEDRDLAGKVAPKIVLLAFFGKADLNGNPEKIETVITKLKRFAPIAEKHGFTLGLESLLNEKDHRYIMDQVGSPSVKVYYDTANSDRMGYDIYSEIKSLGTKRICEIHIKQDKALLGEGGIDFIRIKKLLKYIQYDGWLIIEGSTPKGMSRQESCQKNASYALSHFNKKSIPASLKGAWSLDLDSGEPAWINLVESEGKNLAYFRIYVGPEGPYEISKIEGERISFSKKRKNKKTQIVTTTDVHLGLVDGKLGGSIERSTSDKETPSRVKFTGTKIPPLPKQAPDLSKVKFGEPITLFNGKDLTGWQPYESDKKMGWSAEGGLLVNNTPKTDFSATGAYANLRTVQKFEDFKLHIEFLIEKDRNSGVYLRGMYEAQVVDRDSRMQGLQGVGSIFSRIAPSKNAGKVGGEWQSYDITLVDRHVTVVLNGEKVIDNQPVIGPTGGAIHTNPMTPGPIYLQGDHTSVKYRNIYLSPLL